MNKCTDVEAFPNNLPVAGVLQEVLAASQSGPVVVCAPPGSGKTLLFALSRPEDNKQEEC